MEQQSKLEVMRKIARWLAAGVEKGSARDKTITRLCGSYRIWTNDGERLVQVGAHGRGQAIVVAEKRPVQAKESLYPPAKAILLTGCSTAL